MTDHIPDSCANDDFNILFDLCNFTDKIHKCNVTSLNSLNLEYEDYYHIILSYNEVYFISEYILLPIFGFIGIICCILSIQTLRDKIRIILSFLFLNMQK